MKVRELIGAYQKLKQLDKTREDIRRYGGILTSLEKTEERLTTELLKLGVSDVEESDERPY